MDVSKEIIEGKGVIFLLRKILISFLPQLGFESDRFFCGIGTLSGLYPTDRSRVFYQHLCWCNNDLGLSLSLLGLLPLQRKLPKLSYKLFDRSHRQVSLKAFHLPGFPTSLGEEARPQCHTWGRAYSREPVLGPFSGNSSIPEFGFRSHHTNPHLPPRKVRITSKRLPASVAGLRGLFRAIPQTFFSSERILVGVLPYLPLSVGEQQLGGRIVNESENPRRTRIGKYDFSEPVLRINRVSSGGTGSSSSEKNSRPFGTTPGARPYLRDRKVYWDSNNP
jgi:hypothetical protein